jgi:solute carrier family 6 GABA transporter-like protein 1
MDAILICSSNVLFENFAALAIFGIVGFLRRWPWESDRLGAFVVGFLTLPEAVLQMPGSQFWAFLLFFTLIVLGFSSAFVMLDVVATLLVDSGLKYSRPTIVSVLTLACFLMCLPYCTEFGYYLLDGIDRWMNNVLLIFVVWAEVTSASTVYRYKDVISETGKPAFVVYNFGYLFGQLLGIIVAHVTGEPGFGAAAGCGLYVVCAIISIVLAKGAEPLEMRLDKHNGWIVRLLKRYWNPDSKFGQGVRTVFSRFYYLAFYSVSSSSILHFLNICEPS